MAPGDRTDLPPYRILATFNSEIAKKNAPSGVMIGTTAIAASTYGKGRVLCFSPHPEKTKGLEEFVCHAVRSGGQQGSKNQASEKAERDKKSGRFQQEILAFERSRQGQPASTKRDSLHRRLDIQRWKTLAKDFPGLVVINPASAGRPSPTASTTPIGL